MIFPTWLRQCVWLGAAAVLTATMAAADAAPKKKAKGGATGPARWEETIRKFEAEDAAQAPAKGGVLLVGGSNARRWTDVATYFPGHTVLNRGFGGAQLADVLHYADRIVLPYAPRIIVLNAGGNDLNGGRSLDQVAETAAALAAKVRAALPATKILQVGVPPVLRAAGTPEGLAAIRAANARLATAAQAAGNVEFIDLVPAFLGADGQPRRELFVEDGTHFSAAGYAVVAGLLRGKL
jgi:lysophospholipase L1-like esterase